MRKAFLFIFLLSFVLNLTGAKVAVLEKVSRPERILIDQDKLYVLEGAYVYIYSMKDYSLLKKFGKKGNGPGELNPVPTYKLQMEVQKGNIVINSKNKIVTFNGDGEVLHEKRLPFIVLQVIPIEKNYAISKSVFNSGGSNYIGLLFFDSGFEEIKTAYSRYFPHSSKSGKIDMIPHLVLIRKYKNEIYCFDQDGDFEINVYNASGKLSRKIKTECKKRKIPRKYIEKTWEWARKDVRLRKLKEEIRNMAYFPDYFPVMKNFVIDDDKIYVQTYDMKLEEDQSRFIVTDLKGKILKKIYLSGADLNTIEFSPYTFVKGDYIYLYDNPDTENIELHIEKIW